MYAIRSYYATVSGYVSPYAVAQDESGAEVTTAAAETPPPAKVKILNWVTLERSATNCSGPSNEAQRYLLSNGRRVVLCGPPAADPVAALNHAGLKGVVVVGPVPARVELAQPAPATPKPVAAPKMPAEPRVAAKPAVARPVTVVRQAASAPKGPAATIVTSETVVRAGTPCPGAADYVSYNFV